MRALAITILCLVTTAGADSRGLENNYGIIPMPCSIEAKADKPFQINADTAIVYQDKERKASVAAARQKPIINVDYKALVSVADINHTGQISTSYFGLPIGTGTMNSLVWNDAGNTLKFQINRVDVFGYNSASTYPEGKSVHSDYGYGCGFVNVNLGGNPITSSTTQHLSMYDGKLAIQGDGVSVDIIADTKSDVFALKIDDSRPSPSAITIDLVMLQDPDVTIGTHTAVLRTSDSDGQISLKQTFEQPAATGYPEFDHYCSSAVVIDVRGRSASVSYPDARTIRLTLPAGNETFYVYMASDASMERSVNTLADATETLNAAMDSGFDLIYSGNQTWWQNYWSKSYIHLPEDIKFQANWIYNFYLNALCMRGDYPAKFTGLIWNTVGLNIKWGAQFWGYNQENLHHAFDAANHGELQKANFKMHTRNYENYALAARQQWGSEGIFINETEAHNGPERLPAEIARDLKSFFIDSIEPTTALDNFAGARHTHISRWQIHPTYWTTFTTINASERAEHYWNHYLYTLDTAFLAKEAYPMLKGAAEFYRNFPNLKMENDGKYHIYRTNHHEHIMGGNDIIDDLSFIKGVMQATKKASEILKVDEDLRPKWQDIVDNLTPYPLSGQANALGSFTRPDGKPTWASGLGPALQQRRGGGSVSFNMVKAYDVLTLESRDQALDGGDWELAINTFEGHPFYNNNMIQGDYGDHRSRNLIDAARLGRSEFNTFLINMNNKMEDWQKASTNRLRGNPIETDDFQGYGIFSHGLQEGLMQSIAPKPGMDPVIRVFPAWDINREASFQLLAKGGFLVSSSARNGAISFVEIDAQFGGTCRIRNPWVDTEITIYRDGKKSENMKGSLLLIQTKVGEIVIIAPKGKRLKPIEIP
jgi:hypothetical protein